MPGTAALGRADLLHAAIELARGGFAAWDGFILSVETMFPHVERDLGADAGWCTVYRPHNRPWRAGERVRLPALAGTLGRLADFGWDEFYEGETGQLQAHGLAAAGSTITKADLEGHTQPGTIRSPRPIAAPR